MANALKVDHETVVAAVALSDETYKRMVASYARKLGKPSYSVEQRCEDYAERTVKAEYGFTIADLFKRA